MLPSADCQCGLRSWGRERREQIGRSAVTLWLSRASPRSSSRAHSGSAHSWPRTCNCGSPSLSGRPPTCCGLRFCASVWVLFGATLRVRMREAHWSRVVNKALATLAASTIVTFWL